MKIASKTLVTMFVIGLLALNAPMVSAIGSTSTTPPQQRQPRRLERLYQRHDRKMELRASVLGISADQLHSELKTASFDQVIKRYGFKDRQAFNTAVLGKIKNELKHRGWSDKKIENFVQKRIDRLNR